MRQLGGIGVARRVGAVVLGSALALVGCGSAASSSSTAVTRDERPPARPSATRRLACSSSPESDAVDTRPGSLTAAVRDARLVVSWTGHSDDPNPLTLGARVRLAQASDVVLDAPVVPPSPQGERGAPASEGWQWFGRACVAVPAAGRPTAYVIGHALGMTCCTIGRVYEPRPDGGYRSVDRDFGRGRVDVVLLGGEPVVVASDPDFAGVFDSMAASGLPERLLRFADGQYVDITTRFPDRIERDAARWWSAFQAGPSNGRGLLAAWAADECRLGRQTEAFSTLASLAADGKLGGPPASSSPSAASGSAPTWPVGAAYVDALRRFLRAHEYCD